MPEIESTINIETCLSSLLDFTIVISWFTLPALLLANKAKFNYFLSNETWQHTYQCVSFDDKVNCFVNTLQFHYNMAFPLKSTKVRKDSTPLKSRGWLTQDIIKSSNELNDLFILQKQFPQLTPAYKARRTRHRILVDTTKKQYYDSIICSADNKIRQMWGIVRGCTSGNT